MESAVGPEARIRGALEDVASAQSRPRQSAGSQPSHVDDAKVAIQEHDIDREPHPERMHGPASLEEHRVPGVQLAGVEQPPHALAP